MICDVLCKFDDRNRHEGDCDVGQRSSVDRVQRVGLQCRNKGELRNPDKGCQGERMECVIQRREVHDAERLDAGDVADNGEQQCQEITDRNADHKRNQLDHFAAAHGCGNNCQECDGSDQNRKQAVGVTAVVGHPGCCGSGKRKSDERNDRADDDCRHELVYPAASDRTDNQCNDDIDKSGKENTDNDTPVAIVLTEDRRIGTQEGKGASKEYRALLLCEQDIDK